jgi:hypothetical protein
MIGRDNLQYTADMLKDCNFLQNYWQSMVFLEHDIRYCVNY